MNILKYALLLGVILGFLSVDKINAYADEEMVSSKVAMLHFNPTLLDFDRNVIEMGQMIKEAFDHGANIVITPELSTTGFSITADQIFGGIGESIPFKRLEEIRSLAMTYNGYVFVGLAEMYITKIYNSVAILSQTEMLMFKGKEQCLVSMKEEIYPLNQ